MTWLDALSISAHVVPLIELDQTHCVKTRDESFEMTPATRKSEKKKRHERPMRVKCNEKVKVI